MESKLLIACAARLHHLQAMYVTFRPGRDGICGLQRLIGLIRSNPAVRISDIDAASILAVTQRGDWGHVSRTVTVWNAGRAGTDFLEPMARDIESVAAGDHIGKPLFTNNQRRREEAVAKIVSAVLTPKLKKLIEEWGLQIFADGHEVDGLFGIEFSVRNDDHKTLLSIVLDGWSGRVAIDGKWGDLRYSQAEQLQGAINDAFNDYIEKETSAVTA